MATTQQIQINAITAAMEHLHFTSERAQEVIEAVLGSDAVLLAGKAGKGKTKRVQKAPGEKRKQTEGQIAYKAFLSENLSKLKAQIATAEPELSKKEVQNKAMKEVGTEWRKLQAEKSEQSNTSTPPSEHDSSASNSDNDEPVPAHVPTPAAATTSSTQNKGKAKVVKKGNK
jgi:hypothetical protein